MPLTAPVDHHPPRRALTRRPPLNPGVSARLVGTGRVRDAVRRVSRRDLRRLPELVVTLALTVAAGWGAAWLFDGPVIDGVVNAALIGTPLVCFERGMLLPRLRARLRRMSTPAYLAQMTGIFLVTSAVGNAAASLGLWLAGAHAAPFARSLFAAPEKLLYGFAVLIVITVAFRIRDLVGSTILVNLLLGRYHRPVHEERLFMFLDLVGSTRFADQHGDLRAQEFLSRVFDALAAPVRRHGGSIDDYIGDGAMVTWPLRRGIRDAAAVRCLFDFHDEIERGAATWLAEFGELPRFRAALHGGGVVTAEIGLDRHKITYFGDVVNTASRLEGLAKSMDEPILASGDLVDRLRPLPPGIMAEDLGRHALRGRGETIAVVSLRREPRARAEPLRHAVRP